MYHPKTLRPIVLQYFHGLMLSAHLGMAKTPSRIRKVFYWPNIRSDICNFVRGCQECRMVKPAQDSRVRLHSSEVMARPLESVFINFFGPTPAVPQSIVSDNAAVFKSRTFYCLCFSWGIRHFTTLLYYPQASQVECFNHNLKVALIIYHNSQHTCWNENLPSSAIAFNTVWCELTGSLWPPYSWGDR
jgi:hypothetical protein